MTETTAEYTAPERYTILSNEAPAETVEVEQIPENEEVELTEAEPEAEAEVEQTPESRKKDAQSRIRELANKARAAEERAQAAEAALAARDTPSLNEPKPEDYPGGVYNDNYLRDLRAFDKAGARAEFEREQNAKAVEAEKQAVVERENEFRKSNPEYDYAIKNFMNSGLAGGGLADILLDMPNWLEIVNQIGNDEDLVDEMVAMTPAQRLIKIGSLSAQSGTVPPQKTVRISQAAKPITPVSGGKTVLTGQAAIDAALKHNANGHIDYDAYRAAVKAAK